jgi:hypothetical protein
VNSPRLLQRHLCVRDVAQDRSDRRRASWRVQAAHGRHVVPLATIRQAPIEDFAGF